MKNAIVLGGLAACLAFAGCSSSDSATPGAGGSAGATGGSAGNAAGSAGTAGIAAGAAGTAGGPTGGTAGAAGAAGGTAGDGGQAGSGTAGKVKCGTTSCDLATEKCCAEPSGGTCAPSDNECPAGAIEARCDEAADCKQGQVCCMNKATSINVIECSVAPCSWSEVCVNGGTCSADLKCVDDTNDWIKGGNCTPANPAAVCGATTCGNEKPVCCWDASAGTGECVGACLTSGAVSLRCSSKADCAGYQCCVTSTGGSECLGTCEEGALCKAVDDCPEVGGKAATACEADSPAFPAGVKKCVY